MLSGYISQENFSDVLRSLSQRRRNGVLEISHVGERLAISFDGGKIVSVDSADLPVPHRVAKRLLDAGLLDEAEVAALAKAEFSTDQLYQHLVGSRRVSKENFTKAKAAVEFDILHSLKDLGDGEYVFTPKVVRTADGLSLKFSPGQLLLDYVDLESHQARYDEIFAHDNSHDIVIHPLDDEDASLTSSESVVWNSLSVTNCLRELLQKCLLSEFEIRACLLSFYDRRLVSIETLPAEAQVSQVVAKKSSTPRSSENNTPEELQAARPNNSAQTLMQAAKPVVTEVKLAQPVVAMPELPASLEVLTPEERDGDTEDEIDLISASDSADQEDLDPEQEMPEVVVDQVDLNAGDVQVTAPDRTIHTMLISWNYKFLMEENIRIICLFIMLAHLATLAFVMPGLIGSWFTAVKELSSLYSY